MQKKIHILHVTYSMDRGGIETFLMEVLRNIDKSRFKTTPRGSTTELFLGDIRVWNL